MATSHSIVTDAPRVLDSPQIRFFCCLMNRYLREKTEKKKQNLLFNKVIRAVPRRTFPQRIFSGSDISPKNLFIYLFILTFIYRWYTKVAGTNEFQQKIYKITLKTN